MTIESTVDIRVVATPVMKAFSIDADDVPGLIDEVPILAVLAMFCQGRSVFKGLEELRIKESDRLDSILQLIRACGGSAHVSQDDLYIEGCGSEWTPTAFRFDSAGDHRMAMSAAILATRSKQPCQLLNAECVSVSFPNFYDFLNHLDVATFSHRYL
jgi:3-phosphoshikimate 1-carboxyvinyltransferase